MIWTWWCHLNIYCHFYVIITAILNNGVINCEVAIDQVSLNGLCVEKFLLIVTIFCWTSLKDVWKIFAKFLWFWYDWMLTFFLVLYFWKISVMFSKTSITQSNQNHKKICKYHYIQRKIPYKPRNFWKNQMNLKIFFFPIWSFFRLRLYFENLKKNIILNAFYMPKLKSKNSLSNRLSGESHMSKICQ